MKHDLDQAIKACRDMCEGEISETEETTNLTLTKQEFMDKMLQEEDGAELLQLLESGESNVTERLGLCHGEIRDGQVVFDIPGWKNLVTHLRIVNGV